MAEPLKYKPRATTAETAHDELESVLQTLHEAGALRIVNGLVGRFAQIAGVVLDRLNQPGGRRAFDNVTVVAEGLFELRTDVLRKVVASLDAGLVAISEDLAAHDAPSWWTVVRRASNPDARRGAMALVLVLEVLGRELRRGQPSATDVARPRDAADARRPA